MSVRCWGPGGGSRAGCNARSPRLKGSEDELEAKANEAGVACTKRGFHAPQVTEAELQASRFAESETET